MHRAFIETKWIDFFTNNTDLELPEEILFRFNKILRIRAGEKIAVFDGEGRQIEGFLNNKKLENTNLVIKEPPKPQIILLQAALEEAKISETLKRATEFGVDKIIIFASTYSQSFHFPKLLNKLERIKDLAKDAARQSERFFIPKIIFEQDLESALTLIKPKSLGFYGLVKEHNLLSQELTKHKDFDEIYIVIGPEGGLAPRDLEICNKHKFKGVVFSPFVLRSELASLAAISIINAHLKRG
jgi:16S rRNA (uracil1498-N3)-methyltransferase